MNSQRPSNTAIILCGVVAMVWAAFWSEGFLHLDEHFQLLEIVGSKLRSSPTSQVMWEHAAKIRPGLMVFFATMFCNALQTLGVHNPFDWAFGLRLMSGILAVSAFAMGSLMNAHSKTARQNLFLFALAPLIMVRFSSESWAMSCFFLGAALIAREHQRIRASVWYLFLGGLFCGLAFECRFQSALMMVGPAAALVIVSRQRLQRLSLIGCGFIVAFFIGRSCDYWLYGEWVLTPLRYFDTNIVQGVASQHGRDDVFAYAVWLILLAPPLGLWLLASGLRQVVFLPVSLASLVIVPFLVAHLIIPHKELRFLIPLLPWVLLNAKIGARPLRWVNAVYLVIASTLPLRTELRFYKELWDLAPPSATISYVFEDTQDPLNRLGAVPYFYTQAALSGHRLSEQDIKTSDFPVPLLLTLESSDSPYRGCQRKASELWPALLGKSWSEKFFKLARIRPLRLYDCPRPVLAELLAAQRASAK